MKARFLLFFHLDDHGMSRPALTAFGMRAEELADAERAWRSCNLDPGLLHALLTVDHRSAKAPKQAVAKLLEDAARGKVTRGTDDPLAGADALAQMNGVELTRIELTNFLQYEHEVIELRTDDLRPLVVIEGQNGYGKSALVRAVRFALRDEKESGDIAHFVHASARGSKADAKVALRFRAPGGGAIDVTRVRTYKHTSGGWAATGAMSDITVRVDDEPLVDAAAREWLEAHFPHKLLDYFVFDAESSVVQELSGQRGTELPPVRAAVEAALGIEPLRRVAGWCRELATSWSGTARDRKAAVDDFRALQRTLSETLERLGRAQSEAQGEWKSRVDEAARAKAEAERFQSRGQPEKQRRREEIQAELGRAKERLLGIYQEKTRILGEILPLALLGLAIDQRGSRHPSQEPSPEWRQGAEHVIEKTATALADGRFAWVRDVPPAPILANLLAEVVGLPRTPEDPHARERLRVLAELRSKADEARARIFAHVQSTDDSISVRVRELEAALEELACPSDEARWNAARKDAEDAHAKCESNVATLASRLNELANEMEAAQGELDALGDGPPWKDDAVRATETLASLAKRAAEGLDRLASDLLENRLRDLEKEASHALVRTAHKHDVLSELRVDRHRFRYAVFDKAGRPAPSGRSTGERNLLALCLVHAIREVAGTRFPLVVEGALRVLDPEHREAVLQQFFVHSKGQTLLIVTPDELPSTASAVEKRVAQRFVLLHDGEQERTRVVEDARFARG